MSHPQHSIIFPIKPVSTTFTEKATETDIGNWLSSAFDSMVDSSDFMEACSSSKDGLQLSACKIPAFGNAATVTFAPSSCDALGHPTEYTLSVHDFERPVDDFGMFCLELHRHCCELEHVVDIEDLETKVLEYMNSQMPDPGMDAELTSSEAIGSSQFSELLDQLVDATALSKLQVDGYVVIDNVLKTPPSSIDKLGEWANKGKTGQDNSRSDTVAFLNRNDALECGLEDQYDFLLTLASHLNDNLDLYASPYKPVFPGTTNRPLTNPKGFMVQMAEYGCSDYYNPHSDNSIDRKVQSHGAFEDTTVLHDHLDDTIELPPKRSNWRCITAILYLNEGWKKSDAT